ncbi:MAG: NAD(+)/NADH kinase, partial [Bifidobacteriaceae bacterium]|nr:NAD(+)/NADH kinase [Bifidobacteriaceae bacterium]
QKTSEKIKLIISLGGDGTILRASEIAFQSLAPILAVNLGRVGFLTAADSQTAIEAIEKYFNGQYKIEKRSCLSLVSSDNYEGWALNEVAIEKADSNKMLALSVSINDTVLSTYGADAILCSTATGSTAHAFSAGGPIIWPDVQAIEIVPIAAYAIFNKPIIVGAKTKIKISILSDSPSGAMVSFDGRRKTVLNASDSVEINLTNKSIDFVVFNNNDFTAKLVSKFNLPVHEWRYINYER